MNHLGVDSSPNANVTSFNNDDFTQAEMLIRIDDVETSKVFEDSSLDDISSGQLPALSAYVENVCAVA